MEILNIFLDDNLIYLNYDGETSRIIVDETVLFNGRITDENYLLYVLKKEIENRDIKSGTDTYVYFMKAYIHKVLSLPNLSESDMESMLQIESKEYFETDEKIIPIVEKNREGKYSVSAIDLDEFEKLRKIFEKLNLNLKNVYPITSYVESNVDGAYVFVGRRSADVFIKKGLIENEKNERVNSNGQKLEGYPSYAWLQCEYQECGLILEFANYYDLDMSDARKKDLENIKASLEQQIADYTGSDKDENNKNVG